MSRVVDDRVVEMEFDNRNFERNVGTSLSTLDRLKAALSFRNTDDSFNAVERAALGLGHSFSMMEQIATGALRNFGASVERWAEKTIRAMSGVDNIMNGMSKFEKITKSSATLMAQGFDADQVTSELKRLNWFTDETSYNLTDMVDNISKFTATGQGLTESADAMMGIALWAASAGQNAGTASRAMYQLSQAMGAYMRKEDWRSVQNANMDMKEFRELALETGVEMKTLTKNSKGLYRSLKASGKAGAQWFDVSQFADTLTEGAWFTPEVMMGVYRKYTKAANDIYGYIGEHVGATVTDAIEAMGDKLDAFSLKAFLAGQEARSWGDAIDSVKDALSTKWMGIFQLIFGQSKEATKFFTDLSYAFYDMFVEPMSGLIASFEKWSDLMGRTKWQTALVSALEGITEAMNTLREAFDTTIFTDRIRKVKNAVADELPSINNLRRPKDNRKRQNMFTDTATDITDEAALINARADLIMSFTNGFAKFANKIKEVTSDTEFFTKVGAGAATVVLFIRDTFKALWGALDPFKPLVKDGIATVRGWIISLSDSIVDLYQTVREKNTLTKFFTSLVKPFVTLKNNISEFADIFLPRFKERWAAFTSGFDEAGGPVDTLKSKFESLGSTIKSKWEGLFTNFDAQKAVDKVFETLSKIKQTLYDIIGVETDSEFADWVTKSIESISTFLDSIKDVFSAIWNRVTKGITEADVTGLEGVGEWLKKAAGFIGDAIGFVIKLLSPLFEGLKKLFSNLTFENAADLLSGAGIAALGTAIYTSVYSFMIEWGPIGRAFKFVLDSLSGIFDGFTKALNVKALKDAATAIAILVGSLLVITLLPKEELLSAVVVMATVIGIMVLAIGKLQDMNKVLNIGKGGLNLSKNSAGGTFLAMGATLLMIAFALRMLAKIDTKDLQGALTVIGIITIVIAAVVKLLNNNTSKQFFGANFSNRTIFGGQKLNVGSANSLAKINVANGPAAVIFSIALAVVGIAAAIAIIQNAVDKNPESFTKAAVVVGLALAIFATTAVLLRKGNSIGGGKASWAPIVLMTLGLLVFAKAFATIAEIKIDTARFITTAVFILTAIGLLTAFAKNSNASGATTLKFMGFAAGMVILAGAISLMLMAIKSMAESFNTVTASSLVATGVAMAAMVGMLGLLALIASADRIKPAKVAAVSFGMLLMAFALTSIFDSLGDMAEMFEGKSKETLIAVGIALVVITGVMALFAVISSMKNIKTGQIVDVADSMDNLAFAILIIAGALWIIGQIDPANMWSTIAILTAAIAAISVLTVLASSKFGKGIDRLGSFLKNIAVMFAAIFVVLTSLAKILRVLGDNSFDAEQAISNFDRLMTLVASKLGEWTILINTSLLEAAYAWIPSLIKAVVDLAIESLNALLERDPLTGLTKIDTLIQSALAVAIAVVDGLIAKMDDIVEAVGGLVVSVLSNIGEWLSEHRDDVANALRSAIDGLIEVIVSLFNPLGEKIFGAAWDGENGVRTKIEKVVKPAAYLFLTVWLANWVTSVCTALAPIGTTLAGLIGKFNTLIGLAGSSSTILAGLGIAGSSILAFGLLDEANAQVPADQRHKLVQDYYASKAGLAEIRRKEGIAADLPVDPALMRKYAMDAYNAGYTYDTKTGRLIKPAYSTSSVGSVLKPLSAATNFAGSILATSKQAAALANGAVSGLKMGASPVNVTSYTQNNLTQPGLNLNELFRNNRSLLAKEGFSLDMLKGMSDYDVQSLLKSLGISIP